MIIICWCSSDIDSLLSTDSHCRCFNTWRILDRMTTFFTELTAQLENSTTAESLSENLVT